MPEIVEIGPPAFVLDSQTLVVHVIAGQKQVIVGRNDDRRGDGPAAGGADVVAAVLIKFYKGPVDADVVHPRQPLELGQPLVVQQLVAAAVEDRSQEHDHVELLGKLHHLLHLPDRPRGGGGDDRRLLAQTLGKPYALQHLVQPVYAALGLVLLAVGGGKRELQVVD